MIKSFFCFNFEPLCREFWQCITSTESQLGLGLAISQKVIPKTNKISEPKGLVTEDAILPLIYFLPI